MPDAAFNSTATRRGSVIRASRTTSTDARSREEPWREISMSSTRSRARGASAAIVRSRPAHFPASASAKIRSNCPSVGSNASISPSTIDAWAGISISASDATSRTSRSMDTTSTSVREPSPVRIHASPTPSPVPSSRIRPPDGVAAARTASSSPTPRSHECSKPCSAALLSAATTQGDTEFTFRLRSQTRTEIVSSHDRQSGMNWPGISSDVCA